MPEISDSIKNNIKKSLSTGARPQDIIGIASGKDAEFDRKYRAYKNQYGDSPAATKFFLETVSGSSQSPIKEPDEEEKQGFFSRLVQSVNSVQDRFERSFGTQAIREGRKEVSKGFDIADIPGDIADVTGVALPSIFSMAAEAVPVPGVPRPLRAAIGGLAGEEARQTIGRPMGVQPNTLGHTPEQNRDLAKVAAREGIGSAVGIGLEKVATSLLKPFAKYFDADIARIAAQRDVKLPLSAQVDSPALGLSEAIATKGVFGGGLKDMVDDAGGKLLQQADDVARQFALPDETLAGKSLVEGLSNFKSQWISAKNKLYNAVADSLPESGKTLSPEELKSTVGFLETIVEKRRLAREVTGDNTIGLLENTLKNLRRYPKIDSLLVASKEISDTANRFTRDVARTGDDATLNRLSALLDSDISTALKIKVPEAAEALSRADSFYEKGIYTINSQFSKTIKALKNEPSQLVSKIFLKKSPQRAREVMEMLSATPEGATAIPEVQSAFVKMLIDSSTDVNGNILVGSKLQKALSSYGEDTLQEIIGADAKEALAQISKLSTALGRSQGVIQGSQTSFIGKIQAVITAIFFKKFKLAGSLILGDKALQEAFSTKLARKWLSSGIGTPALLNKAASLTTRLGSRAATGKAINYLTQ